MNFQKRQKREEEQPTELLHDCDGEHRRSASEAQIDSSSSPTSNGRKKVSHADIEFVQSLIERCLVSYMARDEVVTLLVKRVNLEPHFITLVWQRLEEENPEFFSAYNVQLILKKQIKLFNTLLAHQYLLTNNREYRNVTQPSLHNGLSHMPGATYMESLGYESPYQAVNGVAAAGNFYPFQTNIDGASDNHEMDIESYDQFSFEPDNTQRWGVQSMAFGASRATFTSNMCNIEGFQPALDGGSGNPSGNLGSHCNLTTNLTNIEGLAAFQSYQSSLFPSPDMVDMSPDECDIGTANCLLLSSHHLFL